MQTYSRLIVAILVVILVLPLGQASFAGQLRVLVAARCKDPARRHRPLYANFHNHTINTPDDHFLASGMDKQIVEAKQFINILGISDHTDQIPMPMWWRLNYLATTHTSPPENFFVLPGGEATYGGLNPLGKEPASHINIFYSTRYFGNKPRVADWGGVYAPTLDDLWARLAEEAAINPRLIFQINHPWAKGNLRDLVYPTQYAILRGCGVLIEVDSGVKPEMAGGIHWYERAIQQTWLAAPTANNDGPGGLMSVGINRKSAVWVDKEAYARDPSQEVWQAIKDRRVSALNASGLVEVFFGAEYQTTFYPMGMVLSRPSVRPDALVLHFSATSDGARRIGPRATATIHEVTTTSVRQWRVDLSGLAHRDQGINADVVVIAGSDTIAYFLVFRDGSDTTVTAPVWVPDN